MPLIGFIYDPKIEYYLEKLDMPSGGKLKEFDKEKTLALVEDVIQNKESYVAKLAQKEKELEKWHTRTKDIWKNCWSAEKNKGGAQYEQENTRIRSTLRCCDDGRGCSTGRRTAQGKGQHFICTPNPEIVMEARKDAELMSILREADLVVPDGIGVVWASNTARFACRSVWQAMT